MAAASPPIGESESLTRAIDAVQREMKELASAKSTGRVLRVLLVLVLLASLAGTGYWLILKKEKYTGDAYIDTIKVEAQKRLEVNNDKYVREAQLLAEKAGPVLKEAATKQAEKDASAFMAAMEKQSEAFKNNLVEKVTAKLDKHYQDELTKHQSLLEQELGDPKLNDPEMQRKMTENLALAADGLARRYYVKDLDHEIQNLYAAWDKMPLAEAPPKGEQLTDQLTGTLWQVMMMWIASPPTAPK